MAVYKLTTASNGPSIIAEGNISPTLSSFQNQVSPSEVLHEARVCGKVCCHAVSLLGIFVSLPFVCYLVILNNEGNHEKYQVSCESEPWRRSGGRIRIASGPEPDSDNNQPKARTGYGEIYGR